MINQEVKDQAIALCQKLVQQQSYSGHEDGVAKVLEETYKANGFDSVHLFFSFPSGNAYSTFITNLQQNV